jgi:hypothetical protein
MLVICSIYSLHACCLRYGGYSSPGWGHGVRNIVFPSADPASGLETWILLEGGQTRAKVTLDGNYDR